MLFNLNLHFRACTPRIYTEEVRDVIRAVKPDTVMVELCEFRAEALRRAARGGPEPDFLKQLLGKAEEEVRAEQHIRLTPPRVEIGNRIKCSCFSPG